MSRIVKVVPKPVEVSYNLTISQTELDHLTAVVGRTTGDVFDRLYAELVEHSEKQYSVKDKSRPSDYVTLTFYPD